MNAVRVDFFEGIMRVEISDATALFVPLEDYPRLQNVTNRERQNWRLLGDGYAIE
jgi:hypothetical protein